MPCGQRSTPVFRHRELLGSLAYRNRMFGGHYHPTNLSDDAFAAATVSRARLIDRLA
jgi:hypothetical protein